MLLGLLLVGCNNLSPNKWQIERTLANLDCYRELLDQISANKELQKKIVQIRDAKKPKGFDPISVDQAYRLIELKEIKNELDTTLFSSCKHLFEAENDLRGIRFIGKDLVIIEVDKFDRRTLAEDYQRERTLEFHRLIVGYPEVDRRKFQFGGEHQIWIDTLGENFVYEVTQLKLLH